MGPGASQCCHGRSYRVRSILKLSYFTRLRAELGGHRPRGTRQQGPLRLSRWLQLVPPVPKRTCLELIKREEAQAEAERARKAKRWVQRWKAAVFRGGPRRASELLEVDRARERVAGLIALARQCGELSEAGAMEASRAMAAAVKEEMAAARQQGTSG